MNIIVYINKEDGKPYMIVPCSDFEQEVIIPKKASLHVPINLYTGLIVGPDLPGKFELDEAKWQQLDSPSAIVVYPIDLILGKTNNESFKCLLSSLVLNLAQPNGSMIIAIPSDVNKVYSLLGIQYFSCNENNRYSIPACITNVTISIEDTIQSTTFKER